MIHALLPHAVVLIVSIASMVIPPGEESVLGGMLGGDDAIAGCHWRGASIERDTVVAQYDCGATPARVVITLRHPSVPGDPIARSAKFAVYASVTTPASRLLGVALADRLRAREGPWRWLDTQTLDTPSARSGDVRFLVSSRLSDAQRAQYRLHRAVVDHWNVSRWVILGFALGLILLACIAYDRRRARRRG